MLTELLQLHGRDFAVRKNLITRCVFSFARNCGAFEIDIGLSCPDKKQVSRYPVTLPIDMRIDAMRPLGSGSGIRDRDVMRSCAYPDFTSEVCLWLLQMRR